MAGVCTGSGPCDVHPTGHGGNNFVTRGGGFDPYLRAIINALKRKGHPESEAVQLAIGTVQRWARGEGNVTAATRARAAASLAHWEALKAKAHSLTATPARTVDLALSPSQRAAVDKETAAIRERAKAAMFPHKFVAADWTHPNGHPRCKNCGQEESIGGVCSKPTSKPTAGPATSISMTAKAATTVDLAFTEQLHPRGKKGTAQGGKFVAKGSSGDGDVSPAKDARDFQRRTGLKRSGKYDAATAAKVNALLNPKAAAGSGGKAKGKGGKQTPAQKRASAARTASAVNGLNAAQRELYRAKQPTPPPGYRWTGDSRLVAIGASPEARAVRRLLRKP